MMTVLIIVLGIPALAVVLWFSILLLLAASDPISEAQEWYGKKEDKMPKKSPTVMKRQGETMMKKGKMMMEHGKDMMHTAQEMKKHMK